MKRIACFHLYNDYSGSPKVLCMVLEGMLCEGMDVELITSHGGVLDELSSFPNLKQHGYSYCFSNNPIVTMLRYSIIQVYTFFFSFKYMFRKNVVFYINTLLPVGPALAGRLMGKRVVYHYHENAFVKGAFYKALAFAMQKLAHEIICVSAYQASFLKRKHGVTVVHNALPQDFVSKLKPSPKEAFDRKTVLMLSSLKKYKGTRELFVLTKKLPKYKFTLVINDSQERIDKYLKNSNKSINSNLTIFPRQKDVSTFYNNSSVVLNLSDKRLFVETFGMTALEAMSAGLPVIVPTVGGIAEMVEDGRNVYKIDVQNIDIIADRLQEMLSDKSLYFQMARNAFYISRKYSVEQMVDKIISIIIK